mgnify:FL=1
MPYRVKLQQTWRCLTPMSTEQDPNAQLAQTRQEIANWLKAHPVTTSQADATAPFDTKTSASPNVLAGLLLIAIAERVLKRSARLPTDTSALQHAKSLLETTTQKHPRWMLGLAVLAGAGFAASRPWRWLARKDTWLGLLSQLLMTGVTHALEKESLKKESATATSNSAYKSSL